MGEAGRGLHGLSGARVGIMEAQVPGSEIEGPFPAFRVFAGERAKEAAHWYPQGQKVIRTRILKTRPMGTRVLGQTDKDPALRAGPGPLPTWLCVYSTPSQ